MYDVNRWVMCLLRGYRVPLTLSKPLIRRVIKAVRSLDCFQLRGCLFSQRDRSSRVVLWLKADFLFANICLGPCICVSVCVRFRYDLTLCAWSLLRKRLPHKQCVVSSTSSRDLDSLDHQLYVLCVDLSVLQDSKCNRASVSGSVLHR